MSGIWGNLYASYLSAFKTPIQAFTGGVGGIISTCNVDFQYIGEDDCPNRYVADTVNSTSGYLQCKLNNDRSACNKWNNSNKSDKIEHRNIL